MAVASSASQLAASLRVSQPPCISDPRALPRNAFAWRHKSGTLPSSKSLRPSAKKGALFVSASVSRDEGGCVPTPSANANANAAAESPLPANRAQAQAPAHRLCTQVKKAVVAGLVALEVVAPIPWEVPVAPDSLWQGPAAHAVLLSPDTKVPKNAEVALRRAVPVVNQNLRKIQDNLEEISLLLRIPQRKPYGTMESAVKKALALGEEQQQVLLAAVPGEKKAEGEALLQSILKGEKNGLPGLLKAIEDRDPDILSIRLAASLDSISKLAVLQAPGLPFLLPAQYANYPRLTGRAVVEFTVAKKAGASFVIKNGAETTPTGVLVAVLDGYSAPLTAGKFAKLVSDKEYDGVSVRANSQAVLGDARDAAEVASTSPELPLELLPSGEFQPVYKSGLEVADGELPVLPMSVFGALVMAHSPDNESLSSPSQFFFYLYDKRSSGLGGLAFDEGQFAVFGYVTAGKDILPQIKTGDIIQSARLIAGEDRLVVPSL